jgi:hypothetical protein
MVDYKGLIKPLALLSLVEGPSPVSITLKTIKASQTLI